MVWKNENEIVVRKIYYRLGPEGAFYGDLRRQRIELYDLRTKQFKVQFNDKFQYNRLYVVGSSGRYILCFDNEDEKIIIYEDSREIFSAKASHLYKRLKNRESDIGAVPLHITPKSAYIAIFSRDKENHDTCIIIRLDFGNDVMKIIDEDGLEYFTFDPLNPERLLYKNWNKKKTIYLSEPPDYAVRPIFEIPEKFNSGLGSQSIINNTLFIPFFYDPGTIRSKLIVYNIKKKSYYIHPSIKGFTSMFVSPNYILLSIEDENIKKKSKNEIRLYNYKGKLIWKKQIPVNTFVTGPVPISPLENKIALWDNIKGRIVIIDISNLKKSLHSKT